MTDVKTLQRLDQLIDDLSQTSSKEESAELLGHLMEVSLKEALKEQDIVDRMIVALEKPDSFERPRIWSLFRYLDMHSWKLLSSEKQAFVMTYLREHWGKFTDWMGTFVACEILGTREPNDEMLQFFKNAVEVIPPPQNALACYGIQKVADSTADRRIVNAALAILKNLETHPDKNVQQEASQAVGNISRK
jgi:hypothetical protein